MTARTFRVNGRPRTVDVPDDMPLLWVLRDVLGLTGTKYGCGAQLCGACTVWVDGEPVRSCGLPLPSIDGREVTTIEGLADGERLHPVQRAFVECQVPQCGYCQSGQVMSAAALLRKHPKPTPEQVDRAMNGHICRCGTYGRIRKAIERAAET